MMSTPLLTLFDEHHKDIISIIFQLLDGVGQDIYNLKLVNKHFCHICTLLVPVQHFVHILQCIQRNDSIPDLNIPNQFTLNKYQVNKIWNKKKDLFLQKTTKERDVSILMTRFVLKFHTNPFCVQVIQWFPCHFFFLSVLCQFAEYKDSSETMKLIASWERLNQLICSHSDYIEDEDDASPIFGVTKEWIKEKGWKTALFDYKRNQYPFTRFKRNILVSNDSDYGKVISNRELCLFLITARAFDNDDDCIQTALFVNHIKWKEYVKDETFLFAFLRYLNCDEELNADFFIKHFHIHECMNYSTVKQAVEIDGNILSYLDLKWQQDESIVKAAIASRPNFFSWVNKNFQTDKEMLLYRAKHCESISDFPEETIKIFGEDPIFIKQVLQLASKRQYIPKPIASLYECIKNDTDCVWDDTRLDIGCREDVEFVKKCLRNESISYSELSDKWRDNEEILREAVQIDPLALHYASTQFLTNKSIILEAVGAHGEVLEMLESPLNADKEIIEAAVKQSPDAIYFVNKKIFEDEEFIVHLVKLYPTHVTQYMLDMMPQDVLSSLDENGELPKDIQDRLQTVQSMLYIALKQDIHVVNYLPYTWEVLKMTVIGAEPLMKLFCNFYEIPLPTIKEEGETVVQEPCEKQIRRE